MNAHAARPAHRPRQARLFGALAVMVAAASLARLAPPDATTWALLCGGALSGYLAGLLGIGGALVTVPLLYVALPRLGVPAESLPQAVVATSLAVMIPTTMRAAWSHARLGALDGPWLRRMAPVMAVGGVVGACLALQLRGPTLALAFAAQGLWFGIGLLRRGERTPASRIGRCLAATPFWAAGPGLAAFCACVGMGGGSMVTPYLRAHGLPLLRAVATSSALNVAIALGGCLGFLAGVGGPDGGGCNWPAAAAIALASLVFVPLGVTTAHRLSGAALGRSVGLVNVVGSLLLVAHVIAELPAAPRAESTGLMSCREHSRLRLDDALTGPAHRLEQASQLVRELAGCWPLEFAEWVIDGTPAVTIRFGDDRPEPASRAAAISALVLPATARRGSAARRRR